MRKRRLRRCAGSQFDPKCVEALDNSIDLLEEEMAAEALESNAVEERWG